MKLLLQNLLLFSVLGACLALRFSHVPIEVDSDVILVNKPAELKCNYVKFRTETVREINWFISYPGFSAKVFTYHVSTGRKVDSIYPHIKTFKDTATEEKLMITLTQFRGSPINVKCEVSVQRDNGYGKLTSSQKEGEVPVTVIDKSGHQMTLKKGAWSGGQYVQQGRYDHNQAVANQPLVVSCASMNVNPTPNLTLTLNGRNWEETSASSRIKDVSLGGYSSSTSKKVIEGRIDRVLDSMFNYGSLDIECKATYSDFLFEKKNLRLTKKETSQQQQYRPGYTNPTRTQPERPRTSSYGTFNQNAINNNPSHDVIHSRLLDLLDPKKHMHPGVPYDFYSGYILMVAKNVDMDDDDTPGSSGSYYGSRGNQQSQTATTHLYGQLPDNVTTDLQRNYGRFQKISNEKFKISMNPVDVLNLLGKHGYRVIGFTAEADQKMVWTLEQKDFENKIMDSGSDHHGHY